MTSFGISCILLLTKTLESRITVLCTKGNNPYEYCEADNTDFREILDIQYLAYQSEAALFGSKDIPPLKETLEVMWD